jgi:glyoxylase-like metal-dependent hydrolase (beta-lactamase superfamily II)
MQIAPGVYLVDGVRGGNVYLLTDRRMALIDTGMPGNAARILCFIHELGRDPAELEHIVLTHWHIDHAGSAAELQRLTGARTVAHRDELARAREGGRRPAPGLNPGCIDLPVTDGEVLPYLGGLRLVHTPGHTPGSVSVLLERDRVLFVGDTIINNEDRLSRPLPFGSDRGQSERSLERLAGLEFRVCCFGHGPPVQSGGHQKVSSFAGNYPKTPLWWRIARSWRRLFRFAVRLWRG